MKQYCRYCSKAVYGDVWWCELLEETIPERKATKPNNCEHFEFCSFAADNEDLVYKPKKRIKKLDQIKLEI
jgi:hypothetical protein